MTGLLIAVGLFLAVVVVIAIRHDRRQRGMGRSFGKGNGGSAHRTRVENQYRAGKWGGP